MAQILRKVTVKAKQGTIETKGYFHQWFTKVYDDGESFLEAIVEKEDGVIELYRKDSYDIKFDKEQPAIQTYNPRRNR